jgi:hypothetical protein
MKVEPIGHFSWLTFEIFGLTFLFNLGSIYVLGEPFLVFGFWHFSTLVTDHRETDILFEDINIKVYQPHNWKEKGGKSNKK